jgi:pimeloyl-ACP methyl ester carboxylesterase
MADVVLVHGAMHGGWCWPAAAELLAAGGHRVLSPTLTGQGERRGSLHPGLGHGQHVDELAELLFFEDLHEVRLVLHSYAGILAGPLAERAAGRLETVVYLGAFLAEPGQSLLDVEPPEVAERYRRLAEERGDGWRIPADPTFLAQWGVPTGLLDYVGERLTDFPLRCATEAVRYDPGPLAGLRQVYVRHSRPPMASLERSFSRAAARGFELHDLAAGHDMMLEDPAATAALLESIFAGPPARRSSR